MKLKHRGLKTCSKTSRMSVRLAVRLRCSANYDGNRNERKNNPNYATNGIFVCRSLK
ncbi:hypothetical protein Hanom_Chr04g00334181 [Helianthus anomalus]